MVRVHNLFAEIPTGGDEEFLEELLRRGGVRIERIVSRGQASPPGFWYDQDEDEWVLLVKGSAVLGFSDGTRIPLAPGDHLLIPRHARHRVERTDPEGETVWLAVHLGGG
jgi:cupin 2 domain-containing protein